MDRQDGTLKRLKSQSKIQRLLFVDTETHIIEYKPNHFEFPLRLGCAIYVELDSNLNIKRRNINTFYSIEDFMEILERYNHKTKLLHIFAHNIGFDIRVLKLPEIFHSLGYESKPPIINMKCFMWKVKTDRGNFEFLDTANFGVESVEKLGKDLGYSKGKVDFDNATEQELMEYCIRDTEIIEKFMLAYIQFLDHYQLGAFKYTLASQAMTTYRTSFMDIQPYIHNVEPVLELERKGYYGGRTEIFKKGIFTKDEFYYLDVNSMYPYVMKTYDMPVRLLSWAENVPLYKLKNAIKDYYIIADVELDCDLNAYPLRTKTSLEFPTGVFRTTLHHAELEIALQHNHIKHIYFLAKYKKGKLFERFIDFMYNKRLEYKEKGNKSWTLIIKLLMNSLYGKFGALEPHREMIGYDDKNSVWRTDGIDITTGKRFFKISWYGEVFREYKEGETFISNPAIAGAITAYARFTLFKYVNLCGQQNVYYIDTDSIFTNGEGYTRIKEFIDPSRLGALKLETSDILLIINGAKDYIFGNITKVKGINKSAKKTKPGKWRMMQFQSFTTWMNEGGIGLPKAYIIEKQRKHIYSKGEILENGDVIPHHYQP